MSEAPRISVVIPVYNEAAMVVPATLELSEALEVRGLSFEIILAQNGSTDGTSALIEDLAARHPTVRAVHCATPDYGAALRLGILAARGVLVFCDEIDICDPTFYDRALPLLEDGVELVVGSKAAKGARDRRPLYRRSATKIINGMLRISLGFTGTDTHGLKAFQRDALLPVVEACVVTRDLFASELVIRAERAGVRVLEIPVDILEKRPPSVQLTRRVPAVLKNLAQLIWVIRIKGG